MFNFLNLFKKKKQPELSEKLRSTLEGWLGKVDTGVVGQGNYNFTNGGLCVQDPLVRDGAELRELFEFCGLCPSYPFGKQEYRLCFRTGTMHKDQARIGWVRAALKGELHKRWKVKR